MDRKGKNKQTNKQTQTPYLCYLQKTHLRSKETYKLKVRRQEKISLANGNQKKAGAAILIPEKSTLK